MASKGIDSSVVKIKFPILDRKIDLSIYNLKRCELLSKKIAMKETQKIYEEIAEKHALNSIHILLLWLMFTERSITSNKCMYYGIADKATCARQLEILVTQELCTKYSPGNSCVNKFVLTDKGIDLFINIFDCLCPPQ